MWGRAAAVATARDGAGRRVRPPARGRRTSSSPELRAWRTSTARYGEGGGASAAAPAPAPASARSVAMAGDGDHRRAPRRGPALHAPGARAGTPAAGLAAGGAEARQTALRSAAERNAGAAAAGGAARACMAARDAEPHAPGPALRCEVMPFVASLVPFGRRARCGAVARWRDGVAGVCVRVRSSCKSGHACVRRCACHRLPSSVLPQKVAYRLFLLR